MFHRAPFPTSGSFLKLPCNSAPPICVTWLYFLNCCFLSPVICYPLFRVLLVSFIILPIPNILAERLRWSLSIANTRNTYMFRLYSYCLNYKYLYISLLIYIYVNYRLWGLVVKVSWNRFRGSGSIPGATRFLEKLWVRNGMHSASWV
jgi:hypothetical protein